MLGMVLLLAIGWNALVWEFIKLCQAKLTKGYVKTLYVNEITCHDPGMLGSNVC